MHKNVIDSADVFFIETFPDWSIAFFDLGVFEGVFMLFDEISCYKGNRKDNYKGSKHDYVIDVFYCNIASHVRQLEERIQDNLKIGWHDDLMVHSIFEDCIDFVVNFLEFHSNELENSMANQRQQQNSVLLTHVREIQSRYAIIREGIIRIEG